jgi:hypothetical protein
MREACNLLSVASHPNRQPSLSLFLPLFISLIHTHTGSTVLKISGHLFDTGLLNKLLDLLETHQVVID